MMGRKAVAVFAGAIGLVALAGGNASALGPDGWDNLGERPPAVGIDQLEEPDADRHRGGHVVAAGDRLFERLLRA